jgi:hypothetical protein
MRRKNNSKEEILEDKTSGEYICIMQNFNAQIGKDRNIMGPLQKGNRNSEGENLLDMCNRSNWVIGNNWFQKRRSHKTTHYSWDASFGTLTDYFVLTRNLWNILNYVKVILSISLPGEHRILIADFRKVAE